MKTIICQLLLFVFGFFAFNTYSQNVIKGIVLDTKGTGIAFANVILESAKDSTMVAGTITNDNGDFIIEGYSSGILHISCLGFYDTRVYTNGEISVVLQENAISLKEIETTGTIVPKTIFVKDALVTNIKGTFLGQIGTAFDVLGRLPGLIVEDNNVEVLGKGEPIIYVDGRKLQNKSELGYLKSDRIKDVAVIMNPGAKYDATANSVINIQTIRNITGGIGFGNRSVAHIQRYFFGLDDVNLSYSSTKIDVFGQMVFDRMVDRSKTNLLQQSTMDSFYRQDNNLQSKTARNNLDLNLGFNYYLSDNHSFGAEYKNSNIDRDIDELTASSLYIDNSCLERLNDESATDASEKRSQINFFYNGKIGRWSTEFNADALWYNNEAETQIMESSDKDDDRRINIKRNSKPRLFSEKLVLSHPLWKGTLSFGEEFSSTSRDGSLFNPEGILQNSMTESKEGNYSLFTELSQQLGKNMVMAGLRYEYVDSRYYENNIRQKEESRKYYDLFPSLMAMIPIGSTMMQIGYSRKTTRPLYSQLSNSVSYVNKYTYETGNPYLKPSYSNNLSFNMIYKWLTSVISLSHQKNRIISTYKKYENTDIALIKKENTKSFNNIQAIVIMSPSYNWYHPILSLGVVMQDFKIMTEGIVKHLDSPLGIIRLNNTFVSSRGFIINADISIRTSGDSDNMHIGSTCQTNVGISKNLGKNWAVKFNCDDIFNTANKTKIILFSEARNVQIYKTINSQFVELSVSYNINTIAKKYKGQNSAKEERDRL